MTNQNHVDYRLTTKELETLRKLVQRKLHHYRCDPFVFTPTVTQNVSFFVEGDIYQLTNDWEYWDYYAGKEDLGKWHFKAAQPEDVGSMLADSQTHIPIEQIDFFIDKTIREIVVVNEHQHVIFSDGEYTNDLTRGIIFKFDDFEIGFEQEWIFSQEITIHRGDNIIDKFMPESAFVNSCREEEGEENAIADCTREIIVLK